MYSFTQEVEIINSEYQLLMNIISQIEHTTDNSEREKLSREYINKGQQLLCKVKQIQKRYIEASEIGIELSNSMQWLYVSAMTAMQNVYDCGISTMHMQFVKQWPELTQWLKERKDR